MPMHGNEIKHMAQAQAVNYIAERACKNERETQRQKPLRARLQAAHPDENRGRHDKRKANEKPALPARCTRKETPGCTAVVAQADIKHRQHLDAAVHVAYDEELRELIEANH